VTTLLARAIRTLMITLLMMIIIIVLLVSIIQNYSKCSAYENFVDCSAS
jgi:hypothetical protein